MYQSEKKIAIENTETTDMANHQYGCDTMKGVHEADDLFDCFGAKPNKGLSLRSRRDRKWTRERRSERNWRKKRQKAVGEG